MVTLDMHRIDRPRHPPYSEKEHPPPPPPHIYLGGVKATKKADILKQPPHAITHLLSLGCTPLCPDIHKHFPSPSHALCLEHVEDYMDQDLLLVLPTILSFLHNKHPLTTTTTPPPSYLVHCVQGMSRSVTAVLAYFMICEGFPLLETYQFVVNARSFIALNHGFLRQVFFLEDYLLYGEFHTHAHTHAHLQMPLLRAVEAEYRIYLFDEIMGRGGGQHKAGTEKALLEKVETSLQAFRELCERHRHHQHTHKDTHTNQAKEGDEKGYYYCCRHCHHPLFTTQDLVRHGQEATQTALARVAAVAAITRGAAEWYGYEEEFLRQPLLHLKPLPMSYYGGKPPKKKKQKKGGGTGNKGKGGGGKKKVLVVEEVVVEEEEETNGVKKECPWWYVQPVEWVRPLLFSPSSGSRRVSIACPGRHCGAAVGMLERRLCKKQEDTGDKEGEGGDDEKEAMKEEETEEDVVCECGTAVPLVMVRFRKDQCVYVPSTLEKKEEEVKDEEEEEEAEENM